MEITEVGVVGDWIITYKSENGEINQITFTGGVSEEAQIVQEFRRLHGDCEILNMQHPARLPAECFYG